MSSGKMVKVLEVVFPIAFAAALLVGTQLIFSDLHRVQRIAQHEQEMIEARRMRLREQLNQFEQRWKEQQSRKGILSI